MNQTKNSPGHYNHGKEARRNDTLLTAFQALFGGSVVYRLFAHFMKDDEFRGAVEKMIPRDKLPLIAAGTVAAGAVGLIGQRHAAHNAEAELGKALEEMTAEARDLRAENERLVSRSENRSPSRTITEARHESRLEPSHKPARAA